MADASDSFTATVIPMLCVSDASAAIEFYQVAFGAIEQMRMTEDSGRISHAEITIGGAPVMLADEFPEIGVRSPSSIGGSPVMILLEVSDADAVFAQAISAGATVDRPVAGDILRNGKLIDPFGHRWMILARGV